MTKSVLCLLLACVLSVSCSKKEGASPNAPTNPLNTNLNGTWTGTMTRPGGQASISARWIATQDNVTGRVTGPFSMTYTGVTIQGTLVAQFGPSSSGGPIGFQITMSAGGAPALPTCSVQTFGDPSPAFPDVRPGATSMTSSAFNIMFTMCEGFIARTPPLNSTNDMGNVLSLTKQ